MLTLSFRCPECRMVCICGIDSNDEVLSLASDLPVCLPCTACRHRSLVLRQECQTHPLVGQRRSYFELCLKIAGLCRHRAECVVFPEIESFFRRVERSWLDLGQRSLLAQPATVIVARSIKLWASWPSRQIA